MALPCMLALVLACGQGRTDGQDTGATGGAETGALPADTGYTGGGIEDTTAAPSEDVMDTASVPADTSAAGGETAAPMDDTTGLSDTTSAGGEGAVSDSGY
ncbi:MAG: hypothetical protein ACREM9_13910 [Gemmatimonadales bacterium]